MKYYINSTSGNKCILTSKEEDTYYLRLKGEESLGRIWHYKKDKIDKYWIPITKAEYESDITLEEIKAARINSKSLEVGGNHYDKLIQPWDFIYANHLGFDEGNVVKYISRHKEKNGAEDIKKAISYCEHILKTQYGNTENNVGK